MLAMQNQIIKKSTNAEGQREIQQNLPIHTNNFHPLPPSPFNLPLQFPRRETPAASLARRAWLPNDNVGDCPAGHGDGDGSAMRGEEGFQSVVGNLGKGGAVDVDCCSGEDF